MKKAHITCIDYSMDMLEQARKRLSSYAHIKCIQGDVGNLKMESLDMNIYLWKEDIEDGESVMTAEYRPVEYGKDYEVVNNPDKFQLYIDGKEIK